MKLADASRLFITAESFRLSAEMLKKELESGKPIYTYPFHANDAFCCELFLKCLAAIRARQHDPGHKLDQLFNALPAQDQDRVEYHYERLSKGDAEHVKSGRVSPSKSNALRSVLQDGADVFEKIRYWYEGKFPHLRGNFHYPIMAIREVILEIHPHWPRQSENWTKPTLATRQKPKPEVLSGLIAPVRTRLLVPRNLSP